MARIIQELKEKIKSNDEELGAYRKEYCIDEEFNTVKSLYDEKKNCRMEFTMKPSLQRAAKE